jgi:hypothetical protein
MIEETHLSRFTHNDPINRFDPDGRYAPLIILIAGSVAIEWGVRLYCICRFENGQTAYVRTPMSVLTAFSGAAITAIETYCNGAGQLRLRLHKDHRGDCHADLVVICFGDAGA